MKKKAPNLPRPMGESPATPGGRNIATAYMVEKVCATCGESTRKSYHDGCKRVNGRLLVVDK